MRKKDHEVVAGKTIEQFSTLGYGDQIVSLPEKVESRIRQELLLIINFCKITFQRFVLWTSTSKIRNGSFLANNCCDRPLSFDLSKISFSYPN